LAVEPIHYTWTGEETGRLDKVLAESTGVSRTQIQRWLKEGRIQKEGKAVTAKSKIQTGDVLVIQPPEPEPLDLEPEDLPLDILYEDDQLIALNKSAGQVVHPGSGIRRGTLVSALLHHCKGELSGIGGVERPGIVHRLDKETSGVLVIAKTDFAHQHLAKQFHDREVAKIYQAYVRGKPRWPAGSWTWNIGRHRTQRHKMTAMQTGGREARTDYSVLESYDKASLLELELHTGRTHQIRVHSAKAGHPVIGDAVYGKPAPWLETAGVTRQLLHACRLAILHPKTEKTIEFRAPLPEDFRSFREFMVSRRAP
jgi:23S rRNA pseudouridine1911/1915/1917 synthase